MTAPFWTSSEFDLTAVQDTVNSALHKADDGELYLEYTLTEGFVYDDGRLKSVSKNTDAGFGLRSVKDELTAYAHSNDFTVASLKKASNTVTQILSGHGGIGDIAQPFNEKLYVPADPLKSTSDKEKTDFLAMIDGYVRGKGPLVKQVTLSLTAETSHVDIIKTGGFHVSDIRPLVRLSIQVTVERDGRTEQGYSGFGGRFDYDYIFDEKNWKHHANEALRQSLVNLEAIPAPAGEMTVVLGSGWPGVLLHEAVGHGLEGDFNRKGTSIFSGRIGEKVAADGVTVIDQGNIDNVRGSLKFDDEGTPTGKAVLIEDGILKGYMQDRLNARLMNMKATGNGRRQSYAHMPMPRMTNTFMAGGDKNPEEIVASIEKGLYAPSFGGGSVDITSGQFVFEMTEAYLVENGRIGAPVKGATLIGNGPKVMQKITAVGNDPALDSGIGMCGKAGQSVPVCVGQPTLRIDGITVGGSQV